MALVGGAAEMASAFSGARKNRLDLSVGIALGSATQIALFVAPVLVLASYFLGPTPMDLQFWPGAVAMMFIVSFSHCQPTLRVLKLEPGAHGEARAVRYLERTAISRAAARAWRRSASCSSRRSGRPRPPGQRRRGTTWRPPPPTDADWNV